MRRFATMPLYSLVRSCGRRNCQALPPPRRASATHLLRGRALGANQEALLRFAPSLGFALAAPACWTDSRADAFSDIGCSMRPAAGDRGDHRSIAQAKGRDARTWARRDARAHRCSHRLGIFARARTLARG